MSLPWADIGLSLASLPVLGASGYLGLLALLSLHRPAASRAPAGRTYRFRFVVPAHDEEVGIAETVGSLLAVDYPREMFDVIVVADNCADRTAEVAGKAGASVLVRDEPARRGKGFALRLAFDQILAEGRADAAVVVDADTIVSPNLLNAFAARFELGAQALQAHYGVWNAAESWRTRLLTIAFEAFHGVRSMARERVGLSCGLRGNGMAFTTDVLRRVPHEAFSIVEDLEYGIQLAYAGHRIHYVEEARVFGKMPATETASRSQRRRWEGGRRKIARTHAVTLLKRAWHERSPLFLDLALDVVVPSLSAIGLAWAVGLAVTGVALGLGAALPLAPWLWGASAVFLAAYVLRGWSLSGLGMRGLLDLMAAPAYVAWKIALWPWRAADRPAEWVRTERPSGRS